jgi:hypothetical protein
MLQRTDTFMVYSDVTPEPSTLLMGTGLMGIAGVRRKFFS